MKQIPINVPVYIQDFKEEENGRYSTAKLKVFYQGETVDHRLFTKKFSDKIIETLPSTPVVAFYSEEDEDFIGHNRTQYAYGHVPESATIEEVVDEESGNTFVVTDVILYTGRKDNIGEVAKKIVGKQHSLELDPDTLKYKINRDNQGRFLNIEFLDGQFIGLSVLGDDETPAFAGSSFFTTNEDFKTFAENCHAKFDKFLNFLDSSGGKIQVFNSVEYFSKVESFLAKTMQEYQADIYSALDAMGICGWIQENTTDYVVVYQYSEEADKCGNYKYTISNENGTMSLSNPVPVKARFLTDEQEALLDSNGNCAAGETTPPDEDDEEKKKQDETANASVDGEEDKKKDEGQCAASEDDKKDEEDDKKDGEDDVDNTDDIDNDDDQKKKTPDESNASCASTEEEDDKKGATDDTDPQKDTEEEDKEKDKVGTATASFSATTLSDEERAELAGYRKAAKLSAIAEYDGELSKEVLDKYRAEVDNFSKEEIEAKLALEYRNFMKNHKEDNNASTKGVTTFTTLQPAATYDENNPADVVKKYNIK